MVKKKPDGGVESNSRLGKVRQSIMARVTKSSKRWENFELLPAEGSAASTRRPLLEEVRSAALEVPDLVHRAEVGGWARGVHMALAMRETKRCGLRSRIWWKSRATAASTPERRAARPLAIDFRSLPAIAGNDAGRSAGSASLQTTAQRSGADRGRCLRRRSGGARAALGWRSGGARMGSGLPPRSLTTSEARPLAGVPWPPPLRGFTKACADLGSKISLECDGVRIDVPPRIEGIVVLNITSFGGGSDLWGSAGSSCPEEDAAAARDSSSEDSEAALEPSEAPASDAALARAKQSMQDRRLDVVGVHGSFQLGAAQVGLYSAVRLAQASHIKITNREPMPVEVDGEPWIFARSGEIEISFKSQAFMLGRQAPGGHAVATDVVDWALQQEVITVEQRNRMMREIALRAQQASSADLASLG